MITFSEIENTFDNNLYKNLGDIFGIGNGNGEECDMGCFLTGRGCDCGCKDVKPCTTCDSTVCKECDAWDIQC